MTTELAQLNPEVYRTAADTIHECGWAPGNHSGTCLQLALSNAVGKSDQYVEALAIHLGWVATGSSDVTFYNFVWNANDNHPIGDGRRWAVETMKEMERKVREAKGENR